MAGQGIRDFRQASAQADEAMRKLNVLLDTVAKRGVEVEVPKLNLKFIVRLAQ